MNRLSPFLKDYLQFVYHVNVQKAINIKNDLSGATRKLSVTQQAI
ncbi:hypothetical protein SAMN05421827_112151 [Pedobacter terrae]|uniref:Uncharacterized protein n=1 Tax=Pedobacter terrae TaxID=405671 RepID=A0A1G7Y024_9SPHI|nr:hypothetical protein SAMN05421827_112151 [Pedobacter terrae]